MIRPTSRKSSSSKPRIVGRGRSHADPGRDRRRPLVEGDRVAVHRDPDLGEALLRVLPGPLAAAKVDEQQVRVGAPRQDVEPALLERLRERVRVRAYLLLVGAERVARCDPEARRLGGDDVVQRAALHPREDRAVDRLRVLLAAQDEPRPRPGERLVRRRGDEVAVRHRARVDPGRDEAREVGHVAEKERADLVGNLAEAPRLYGPRIGGAATDDQLRPVLLREREHVVVVDDVALTRDAVVDDVVEPAREVDLEAVRQVTAVRELEREDRVARFQAGEVDGHVRLRTRVRLHVRVLRAEELLRAVDGQLLDLVDHLAAAVVAPAGIPLGVLVRRHAADCLQHRRPGEVLGGDQLDLAALPLELAAEQIRDLGIHFGEAGGPEILEGQRCDRHLAGMLLGHRDRRAVTDPRATRNPRSRIPGLAH